MGKIQDVSVKKANKTALEFEETPRNDNGTFAKQPKKILVKQKSFVVMWIFLIVFGVGFFTTVPEFTVNRWNNWIDSIKDQGREQADKEREQEQAKEQEMRMRIQSELESAKKQ